MVDQDATLAHHLLEIAITHSVSAIPPDRPEHDLTLKVTPLEVRHDAVAPLLEPYPGGQHQSLQQSQSDARPYVQSWLTVLRSDKRAIFAAAAKAQAAADWMHARQKVPDQPDAIAEARAA